MTSHPSRGMIWRAGTRIRLADAGALPISCREAGGGGRPRAADGDGPLYTVRAFRAEGGPEAVARRRGAAGVGQANPKVFPQGGIEVS